MQIIGIGTDIVNIDRINSVFQKYGDNFLKKNFHEQEILNFNKLPEDKKIGYLAKRFAAKEAVAKAFGFGIGSALAFRDVAILNDGSGRPYVDIKKTKIPDFDKYNFQISMSDDDPFAVAFVIISR